MRVTEQCPDCGPVETEVPLDEIVMWEMERARLLEIHVRPCSIRWHDCPHDHAPPAKCNPWPVAWTLRFLRWIGAA